ncbi:MAG: MFS transporter [Rhodothermales bacterium]
MHSNLTSRLSLLSFLQFFVWGAWYTSIAVYMSTVGMGTVTFWAFTAQPIGALISPFFLGLIADRYFSTEKVLGVMHLLSGMFLLLAPQFEGQPVLFIAMIMLHQLAYTPTLGLSNSLAFHHIPDPEKDFPKIRAWGTFSWIFAGLIMFPFILKPLAGGGVPEQTPMPLYAAGIAGILLGLYSFTLPHTPPPAAGQKVSVRSLLGIDAFQQLKSPSFIAFIVSSMLICIPLAAYYNFTQLFLGATGVENIAATQTLGQVSEMVFMLLMPLFFRRLGVKWMLLVGMLAWAVRYALFALAAPASVFWMIAAGIILHGICYDFFFVTGQIYIDKLANPSIRSQAQGMLVFATYGIGMLIGAQLSGRLFNSFMGDGTTLSMASWTQFWTIMGAMAIVVAVFFGFVFREPKKDAVPASGS